MMEGKTTGTIFRAAAVMEACVMRMPVWKLLDWMCCANVRICLIPMADSALNSTQMEPILGGGAVGRDGVEGVLYFSIMERDGLAWKVMRRRLWREKKREG